MVESDRSRLHVEARKARAQRMLHFSNVQRQCVAKGSCREGWQDFTKGGCAHYHSIFGFLQTLGLVSSPEDHEQFYRDAIETQIDVEKRGDEERVKKILILGTATPLMPWLVATSIKSGRPFELVVFDICTSPLKATEEVMPAYLPKSAKLKTVKGDARSLMDYFPENDFDLVITDAFLSRFNESERKKVVMGVKQILRPGGLFATTWKCGSGNSSNQVAHYGDNWDKSKFVELIEQKSRELGSLGIDVGLSHNILAEGLDYASQMSSYGGQTYKEIMSFMEEFFPRVRTELSEPVFDVTMRNYDRILAWKE